MGLDWRGPGGVYRIVISERADVGRCIPKVGKGFAIRVDDGSVQRYHIVAVHDGRAGDNRYLNCHILTYAKSTRPNAEAGWIMPWRI